MSRPVVLALATLKPAEMNDRLCATYDVMRDLSHAAGARIVLTSGAVGLSHAQMARLPALELIAVNGVGVDAVDLAEARLRGIRVTTTPDVLSDAVAEMALGLAFSVARRIPEGDRFIRAGHWATGGKAGLGRSLVKGRAGILGYGRIGRRLADLLRGLGMDVLYSARSEKPDSPDGYRPNPVALARDCDVLFVTAAGGSETHGLVGVEVLTALGPTGIVINVSRGSVVDATELACALQSGALGGAGLDVFDAEPQVPDALIDAPNCVLTPHIGSATGDARRAMAELVLENIAAHVAGRPLPTPFEV